MFKLRPLQPLPRPAHACSYVPTRGSVQMAWLPAQVAKRWKLVVVQILTLCVGVQVGLFLQHHQKGSLRLPPMESFNPAHVKLLRELRRGWSSESQIVGRYLRKTRAQQLDEERDHLQHLQWAGQTSDAEGRGLEEGEGEGEAAVREDLGLGDEDLEVGSQGARRQAGVPSQRVGARTVTRDFATSGEASTGVVAISWKIMK